MDPFQQQALDDPWGPVTYTDADLQRMFRRHQEENPMPYFGPRNSPSQKAHLPSLDVPIDWEAGIYGLSGARTPACGASRPSPMDHLRMGAAVLPIDQSIATCRACARVYAKAAQKM